MASLVNIAAIQAMLADAQKNETIISEIRKAAGKVETALNELNVLLAPDYTPAAKERKTRQPRTPKALGADGAEPKKPGRPKRAIAE